MVKKALTGAGLLIALYIAVANYTGFGKNLTSGAGAISEVARTFQGR
jgi:hypothetical protein